jgi:hypothetical protein
MFPWRECTIVFNVIQDVFVFIARNLARKCITNVENLARNARFHVLHE